MPMMVIDNKYDFGDVVYLITDEEQKPRIVCSFEIYKGGEILYRLNSGTASSSHYEFEITNQKIFSFEP